MIRVQTEDFDPSKESEVLVRGRTDIGALVTFTGYVRDQAGQISAIELEHYPAMAMRELESLEQDAFRRWPLAGCLIIHRHGLLKPGERIVLVAAASAHRQAAFSAAEFLMDYLKTRAPFWKKETGKSGEAHWVEAAVKDDQALARWRS